MINKDRLKNICADIGVDLDAQALERFELFASLLVEKNKVLNLTAITDPEGIAVKHFADSLTALRMIELNEGDRVIDVGTGGGFPGIPLLIARPEIDLTMLDSTGKKLAFVSQSVEELGLSANVVHARAEEAGRGELRESFDFAVSRAVAAMNVLCEYCLPFVKVGGTFCAMKGAKGSEELGCAEKAIVVLGGETEKTESFILPDGGERVLINVKKYRILRQSIRALRHRFQKSRSYKEETLPNGSFLPDRKQWTTAIPGDMLLSQRNGGSSILGKDKCHGR